VNASDRTNKVYGGTEDPHSAMPGGHSTLNTVVVGEGVSKSKYTPYFGHHSCMQHTQVAPVGSATTAARLLVACFRYGESSSRSSTDGQSCFPPCCPVHPARWWLSRPPAVVRRWLERFPGGTRRQAGCPVLSRQHVVASGLPIAFSAARGGNQVGRCFLGRTRRQVGSGASNRFRCKQSARKQSAKWAAGCFLGGARR
jgi:hypothetical protein